MSNNIKSPDLRKKKTTWLTELDISKINTATTLFSKV